MRISACLVVALLLAGCGGGGTSNNTNPPPASSPKIVIAANSRTATDNSMLAVAKYTETNEVVAIVGDKNASGNITGIDGFVYIAPNGQSTTIELGPDGLPSSLTDGNGTKATFSNYTPNSVSVTFFDSNAALLGGPITVPIDNALMSQLLQSIPVPQAASSRTFSSAARKLQTISAADLSGNCMSELLPADLVKYLKFAGLVLSVSECTAGAASIFVTGGLASPLALVPTGFACASVLTAALEKIPSASKVVAVSNAAAFANDMTGCTMGSLNSCVAAATTYADEFNNYNKEKCQETTPTDAIRYNPLGTPEPPEVYGVNLIKTGNGTGSVSPCCNFTPDLFPVTLTAKADEGSAFAGWSCEGPFAGACACSGTGGCTLTKAGNYIVTANFTSQVASQKPNLSPFQPTGWSDKIVVSNGTGAPFLSTDTLCVDWAVINNGPVSPSSAFNVKLYVDGTVDFTWNASPPLPNPDYYVYATDHCIGSLSAGTHAIRILADSANTVDELNENDNEYTKSITVIDPPPGEVTGIAFSGGVGGWGSFINVKITPDGLFGVSITCDWSGNLGSKATRTTTTLHSDATCSNSDVTMWPDTSLTITATVTGTSLSVSTTY